MTVAADRHPSAGPTGWLPVDDQVIVNLVSALGRVPEAESYPDIKALVLDGARRGVGPVRALVEGGVPIEVVERAVWHHRGYAHVNVVAEAVPRDLLELMPLPVCRSRAAIPYRQDDDGVAVAVGDPTDIAMLDEVQRRFDPRPVRFVVADADNIMRAVQILEARLASESLDVVAAGDGRDPAHEGDDTGDQISQLVANLVVQASAAKASDIHIEPNEDGLRVRFRIDGVLHHVVTHPGSLATRMVNRLKVMANLDVGDHRRPQDGRFTVLTGTASIDLRLVTFPTVWGAEGAVVRILDGSLQAITLDALGFSPWVLDAYRSLCVNRFGLVLATGPAGSGKTTTLYAALDHLATVDSKVLTVEDPVEVRFPQVTQVQVNPRAGLTFATALRSFLRADPDILLVGEIRDHETALLSVEAALTGHLVLASMHANSAPGAVARLLEMGIAPYLAASSVRGVVSQRLVRRLCRRCRTPGGLDPGTFEHLADVVPMPAQLYRAPEGGCSGCSGSGYAGRVPVAEVMVADDEVSAAVAESRTGRDLARLALEAGMVPMADDGLAKVMRGLTSLDELGRG